MYVRMDLKSTYYNLIAVDWHKEHQNDDLTKEGLGIIFGTITVHRTTQPGFKS